MSQLIQFLKYTLVFQRKHKTLAAMVWLSACLAAALLILPRSLADMPPFVIVFALMTAFAFSMLARYEKALGVRIAAAVSGPIWQVQINSVLAGEIKDADYAAIRRAVFFDSRSYVTQLFNLGNVGLRMTDYMFIAIPLGAFWLAIGCFFFAPNIFDKALVVIQKITPDQAIAAIPVMAQLLLLISLLTLGLHIVIGRHFGFINQFKQACDSRVRRAIACAADGEVSLYRIENDSFIVPDELTTIRTKH